MSSIISLEDVQQLFPGSTLEGKYNRLPEYKRAEIRGMMIGMIRGSFDFSALFQALPMQYKAIIGREISKAAVE